MSSKLHWAEAGCSNFLWPPGGSSGSLLRALMRNTQIMNKKYFILNKWLLFHRAASQSLYVSAYLIKMDKTDRHSLWTNVFKVVSSGWQKQTPQVRLQFYFNCFTALLQLRLFYFFMFSLNWKQRKFCYHKEEGLLYSQEYELKIQCSNSKVQQECSKTKRDVKRLN